MSRYDLNGTADLAYSPFADYIHTNIGPRFGKDVSDQLSAERVSEFCPYPIPFGEGDRPHAIENARWVGYACTRPDAQRSYEDKVVIGMNATPGRSRVGFVSTEWIEDEQRNRVIEARQSEERRNFEAKAGYSM